jgi:hypothetical protein
MGHKRTKVAGFLQMLGWIGVVGMVMYGGWTMVEYGGV